MAAESPNGDRFQYGAIGKRSDARHGVSRRPRPGEFESLEGFFEGTKSPDPADMAAGEKAVEREETSLRPSPSKERSKPYKEPRISLPGVTENGQKEVPIKESQVHTKVRRRNFSVSPSDLSTVTTAPPTPAATETALINHKETPLVTQAENDIETIRNNQASTNNAEHVSRASFGHHDRVEEPKVDDDEGEDLMLPAPAEAGFQDEKEDKFQAQDGDCGEAYGDGFEIADQEGSPPKFQVDVDFPNEFDSQEHRSNDCNDRRPVHVETEAKQVVKITQNDKPKTKEGGSEQVAKKAAQNTPAWGEATPKTSTLGFQADKEQHASDSEPARMAPESAEARPNTGSRPKSATKIPLSGSTAVLCDFGRGINSLVDNDDKEGEGFNLIHDPETPESVREDCLRREKQEMAQKQNMDASKKKNTAPPRTPKDDAQDSNTTSITDNTPVKRKAKKKSVKFRHSPKGYPAGNRGYERVPIDNYSDDNEQEPDEGLRRSRRARTKPLKYWKNERMLYGPNEEVGILGEAMGNMPVVKSALIACETPYKKRKVPPQSKTKSTSASKKPQGHAYEEHSETPFDDRRLKKKYKFESGEKALVWNDLQEDTVHEKVIAYSKNLSRHDLPIPAGRKKSDGKVVGRAAQAFNVLNEQNSENYVGYIMGHLALPPKGIKDYESVGLCAQTFTVCHGQPNALEVSIADPEDEDRKDEPSAAQHFLLGPGDMFRIPQNNTYQLRNHSKALECLLTWTIIRPHS